MQTRMLGAVITLLAVASLGQSQGRPGGPGFQRGPASEGMVANPLWASGVASPSYQGQGTPPVCIVYGPLGGSFGPTAGTIPNAIAPPPAAPRTQPSPVPAPTRVSPQGTPSPKQAVGQTPAAAKKSKIQKASFLQPGTETILPEETPVVDNGSFFEDGYPVENVSLPYDWQAPRQQIRPPVGPRGFTIFGRAEFLYWFVRDQPYRTLLQIGSGASPILVPSNSLHFDSLERQGARMAGGLWLDAEQTWALEAGGFILGSHDTHTVVGSPGTPVLTIPYFDVALGAPFAITIADTALGLTGAQVDFLTVNRFWGADCSCRTQLFRPAGPVFFGHLDALAGFRFAQLEDKLHMNVINQLLGQTVVTSDRFDSVNSFYGVHLGLDGELQFYNFFLNLWGKVALGGLQSDVRIAGDGFVTVGGTTTFVDRGVFALPSNIGEYHPAHFAFLPEVGANLGYQLTNCLRFSVGYSILWLTSTLRAADQMSSVMNQTQVSLRGGPPLPPFTGPLLPVFPDNSSTFFAHGINVGLEFRY